MSVTPAVGKKNGWSGQQIVDNLSQHLIVTGESPKVVQAGNE